MVLIISSIHTNLSKLKLTVTKLRWLWAPYSLIAFEQGQRLVRRYNDTMRRSQVKVALTEKGEQSYQDASRRESVKKIMSQLSPQTFRHLSESLVLLRQEVLQDLGLSPLRSHIPPDKDGKS